MSLGFPAASNTNSAINPRRPKSDDVAAIAREVARWVDAAPNVKSTSLYTHRERPTIRCAIVSQSPAYDPALVDAVSALDLQLAQRPDLSGIDFEVRLFFAAPEQVVNWARGWELWSDA